MHVCETGRDGWPEIWQGLGFRLGRAGEENQPNQHDDDRQINVSKSRPINKEAPRLLLHSAHCSSPTFFLGGGEITHISDPWIVVFIVSAVNILLYTRVYYM